MLTKISGAKNFLLLDAYASTLQLRINNPKDLSICIGFEDEAGKHPHW
jgi:hypothetical protein